MARDRQRARELRRGYVVREAGGLETRVYPEAFGPDEAPPARFGLILVKTPDTAAAAATAARLVEEGAVSLQNGWVEDLFPPPPPPIRQGATTVAARLDEGAVVLVSPGMSWVPPEFSDLATLLTEAGLPAQASGELTAVRLRKLAVNLVINPLTAILNRPNGDLLEPEIRELMAGLVREMAPVLKARGLEEGEEEIMRLVEEVALATAGNVSSMLADVRAGRRTEIEEITGVLLKWGAGMGLELPRHRALYHLVRALEQTDRTRPPQ